MEEKKEVKQDKQLDKYKGFCGEFKKVEGGGGERYHYRECKENEKPSSILDCGDYEEEDGDPFANYEPRKCREGELISMCAKVVKEDKKNKVVYTVCNYDDKGNLALKEGEYDVFEMLFNGKPYDDYN